MTAVVVPSVWCNNWPGAREHGIHLNYGCELIRWGTSWRGAVTSRFEQKRKEP